MTAEHRDRWWDSPTKELGKVVQLDLPEPFHLTLGGALAAVQVSYEAWGTLNAERDNVVLIVHPLTADCHAAGEFAGQPTGWWEPLIGPGRAIDTDRMFVVCPNLIGGCYGSTGPRFPADDGAPYHDRFPLLTPRDLVEGQRRFLEALGVRRVRLVIGPSMGGMLAWEWAIAGGDLVHAVAVVAAPLRASPHQIGLNWLQRRGIELDFSGSEMAAVQGQMVARGIGMLSYRSPVGLEEKFGREWFKAPGSILRERGMFNVESWLRHHGRRIIKRFDPYTYLLFTRAMDLHDVSEGRGGLANALEPVRCRTLVIGISSDNLYPPGEVKLGADILEHLGRDVRYEEIRSPNGHDGFLLDTDQLDSFLKDFLLERRPAAAPAAREARLVRVGILGAGTVAASFLRLASERRAQLRARHGLALEVRAVGEINADKRLDPAFAGVHLTFEPAAVVERTDLDVLIDLTRGVGSRDLVARALARRIPVVTPNKALLRAHSVELDRLAYEHGVRMAYHDSVAAGWPLILALDRSLSQGRITEIRGVLSSACNVMLEAMEEGASLEDALAIVRARDLTEPDPELDVSGWDTAQKLMLLLTRVTGRRYVGQRLTTLGLDTLDPTLPRRAMALDRRVKLAAVVKLSEHRLSAVVRPMAVHRDSHLGLVRGANNGVVIYSPDGGEIVYSGTGSGPLPVAHAVMNDLIGLFDPEHSWTGRFPPVAERVRPPTFDAWLAERDGVLGIGPDERPGALPVLPVLAERSGQHLP